LMKLLCGCVVFVHCFHPLLYRIGGLHRFLASTQPFSVIEEKGEGFEKRKKIALAVCGWPSTLALRSATS
jgi:hypothetical protein